MTERWIALYFPRLSTDRLRYSAAAQTDGRPFALYSKIGNSFILTGVNEAAERTGLTIGLSLSDARALRPDLITQEADDTADDALLNELAAWCERFTPIAIIDAPDGLFLDVTGCAHLFGGEESLLQTLKGRLRAQGFNVAAAMAPTPGAAWACARFGRTRLVTPETLEQTLGPLPLPALRLADATAALLKRLGLKTIGQIAHAPRQPFTARAGQNALLRLDQAFGRAPEALTPRRPPPPVYALRRLAEPILTLEAVLIVAEALCDDLSAKLDERGMGARLLRLCLFGVDGKKCSLRLALGRTERDAKTLLRLFKEKLEATSENFNAEFGFEAMRLDALEVARVVFHTTDLAPASKRDLDAEARFMDAINARLGAGYIGHVTPRDVHAPERASKWSPAGQDKQIPASLPPQDNIIRRPLLTFVKAQPIEAIASVPDGPPVQFRWRRVWRQIVRAEGPERIASDWLRNPGARPCDYYRVEDQDGRRFWLYREGLFDENGPPHWFIRGVFA